MNYLRTYIHFISSDTYQLHEGLKRTFHDTKNRPELGARVTTLRPTGIVAISVIHSSWRGFLVVDLSFHLPSA